MYNQRRKREEIIRHFYQLRGDLQVVLKEAMVSNKDYDIVLGFSSAFIPFIYKVIPGTEIDYYDTVIFSVRNGDIDVFDYFNDDIDEIAKILGISVKAMREYTARMMDADVADIDDYEIIIAIQTPETINKLMAERARRINGKVNLHELANTILDNYIKFSKMNYEEEDY